MNNSPTVLEIDSKAIQHNLRYFRSKIKPQTKLLVVVKAFAYGSEPLAVAKILEKEKIDYLAVAYTNEGVSLRKVGIELPILVLHPQIENLENIINYNLEPNLYNFQIFQTFNELVKEKNLKDYPVHIKLNTGMNRLGFRMDDLNKLKNILKNLNHLKIRSIYSHLAASEDSQEKEFTQNQISVFSQMSEALMNVLDYKPLRHIANTSGIINYPEAQFDMVRLGIGFYGFGNDRFETEKLKNVCNLKTKISQIQNIEKGETVSYNRKYKAEKHSKIAVIPIGYADGIKRTLSNGNGYVSINHQKAPIAGTICMDITMVDVTHIDCKEGDDVILFNHQDHILEIAKSSNTISYEILTSISQRVKRKII